MPVLTIASLAADPHFNPNTTGIPLVDAKPIPGRKPKLPASRRRQLDRLRCQVMGCGVSYAPGGVCGYCRAKVKLMRKTSYRETTRAG